MNRNYNLSNVKVGDEVYHVKFGKCVVRNIFNLMDYGYKIGYHCMITVCNIDYRQDINITIDGKENRSDYAHSVWIEASHSIDICTKYLYCNHHHELTDEYELVEIDNEKVVVNKKGKSLLLELNKLGLKTRSHHIADDEYMWFTILLDNVDIEIKEVFENDSLRTEYNGKKEILIRWKK